MKNDYVKNILTVYNLATDVEKADGISWYADANKIAKRFAKKYKQPVKTVCYVMAALSPNNKWQRNITDTDRVLRDYTCGYLGSMVTLYEAGEKDALKGIACTYTANLIKAFRILETGDVTFIGKGLKTNNFALNIYTPKNDNVTIDYHAISIALGVRHTIDSVQGKYFLGKNYEALANAYREAGAKVGLSASEIQAVTWTSWRNIDKVK